MSPLMPIVGVSSIFPTDVRIRLLRAASVEPLALPGESIMRQRAVNEATDYAKKRCPHLFKQEVITL